MHFFMKLFFAAPASFLSLAWALQLLAAGALAGAAAGAAAAAGASAAAGLAAMAGMAADAAMAGASLCELAYAVPVSADTASKVSAMAEVSDFMGEFSS